VRTTKEHAVQARKAAGEVVAPRGKGRPKSWKKDTLAACKASADLETAAARLGITVSTLKRRLRVIKPTDRRKS
jgi:hypothetical protein